MTERLNRSKRAACTVSAKLEPRERWPRRTAAGRRAVTGPRPQVGELGERVGRWCRLDGWRLSQSHCRKGLLKQEQVDFSSRLSSDGYSQV